MDCEQSEIMSEDYGWQNAMSRGMFDKIKKVIAKVDGENDESSWLAVFQLEDDLFMLIDSWCDYTGWD
jgi:hypothetical protein